MKKTNNITLNQLELLLSAWGQWAGGNIIKNLGYRQCNIVPLKSAKESHYLTWPDGTPIAEQDIEQVEQIICILCAHQPALADVLAQEYTKNTLYYSQRAKAAKFGLSITEYRRRLAQAQQWLCGYFAGDNQFNVRNQK